MVNRMIITDPDRHDPVTAPGAVALQRLRNTIRYNAVFSEVGGLIAFVVGGWVADVIGVDQTIAIHPSLVVRSVGAALIVWSGALLVVAAAPRDWVMRAAPFVIVGDVGWVVASAALVANTTFGAVGNVVVGLVALAVTGLAVGQSLGWHKARINGDGDAAADRTERIDKSFILLADRQVAWTLITDHELYGRIAPNLKAVEATTPNGPGLQRRCTDRSGNSWAETCTLWDEGSVYEVMVDTANHPAPVELLQGRFWIEPISPDTTKVGMRFTFRRSPGLRGITVATVMPLMAPILIAVIQRRWAAAAPTIAARAIAPTATAPTATAPTTTNGPAR